MPVPVVEPDRYKHDYTIIIPVEISDEELNGVGDGAIDNASSPETRLVLNGRESWIFSNFGVIAMIEIRCEGLTLDLVPSINSGARDRVYN